MTKLLPRGCRLGSGCAAPITVALRAMLACAAVLPMCAAAPASAAEPVVAVEDAVGDAVARPTDPQADSPFDPDLHHLADLCQVTVGKWLPFEPQQNIFAGIFASQGKFVRLDLVLNGLMNPPGDTRPGEFDPFEYGNHPVYGFVEIDMDQDVETGGELEAPQYRYLGNVVRFGAKPAADRFDDRVALDASAFDGDFEVGPFVDRHGEEFHLALLGSQFDAGDITRITGNGDGTFDSGETWRITAPMFHRAHGYEPFSLATGGAHAGEYSPICTVQFQHDHIEDRTTISLVFPLKNSGAAQMTGEPPEPDNADPSDQASVKEALVDLHDSAVFLDKYHTGLKEEALITEWQNKVPGDYLDPTAWQITVLLGTSYTLPDPAGEYFVWTDVCPDPRPGRRKRRRRG